MSFAIYPRIGSITRSNVKALLQADPVFNSLTDTQQNANINANAQRIGALRNSLSLSTYNFNTIGNADIDVEALDYSKYIRYAVIPAGITYEGTLYPSLTVIIEQGPSGFTSTLVVDTLTPGEVNFSSTGEFTNAILWDVNNAPVIVTRDNDNSITVDITNITDVFIFEIYRL